MEPKLTRLEPELNNLRSEREKWLKERHEMDNELCQLRPLGRLLTDLSSEIQQLNELAMKTEHQNSNNSNNTSTGTTTSPSKTMYDQGISLSQRHSLWVGLPSLRNLNAILYENIRRLAQDLHSKEVHCSELVSKLHQMSTEIETSTRQHENQWQQLTKQQETSSQTINRLSNLVSSTEKELCLLRSYRITVDQIRSVLASYPGSFLELKLQDLMNSSEESQYRDSSSSHSGGGGSSYHYETKHSESISTPLHHHHAPHTPSQQRSPVGHAINSKETVEDMLSKVNLLEYPHILYMPWKLYYPC